MLKLSINENDTKDDIAFMVEYQVSGFPHLITRKDNSYGGPLTHSNVELIGD